MMVSLGAMLTSCGPDPTVGTTFKPPAGWQAMPAIAGWKMWLNKNKDADQAVMLIRFPNKGKTKFSDIDFSKNPYYKGDGTTKEQRITICGGHPAQYLLAHGTGKGSGKEGDAEMIFTSWGQDTYMTLYARPKAAKADPAAEAAIRSICLKK